MTKETSWNLGLWRGAHGRARKVALAPSVDLQAYLAGYDHGKRNAKYIRAGAKSA